MNYQESAMNKIIPLLAIVLFVTGCQTKSSFFAAKSMTATSQQWPGNPGGADPASTQLAAIERKLSNIEEQLAAARNASPRGVRHPPRRNNQLQLTSHLQPDSSGPAIERDSSAPPPPTLTAPMLKFKDDKSGKTPDDKKAGEKKEDDEKADSKQPEQLDPIIVAATLPAPGSATPVLPSLLYQAATSNPEVSAARSKARALLQRAPQVASLDDPVFSTTVFVERVETAAGPQEAVFSLSQKLPWSGKLNARGEAAGHQAQAAFAELAGVELRIREETKLAYYELFYVQQAEKAYRELQVPLKDLIEIIVARYEGNDAAVGRESILQAETRLDALEVALAQLTERKSKAIARLSKAVHRPATELEGIVALACNTATPAAAAELIARIDNQHPDLSARRSEVNRDRWLRTLACEDYYPDLNLGVSMVSIADGGLSPVSTGEDAFALTLGFNLPVRNARRAAAVREATARITESARRYDNQLADLRTRVYQWREEITAHDKVLKILNDRVIRNADETFELSVAGYQVDRVTFQQLIENYETLLRYRIERITRTAQREQAMARLERAMGISAAAFTCSPPTPVPVKGSGAKPANSKKDEESMKSKKDDKPMAIKLPIRRVR